MQVKSTHPGGFWVGSAASETPLNKWPTRLPVKALPKSRVGHCGKLWGLPSANPSAPQCTRAV